MATVTLYPASVPDQTNTGLLLDYETGGGIISDYWGTDFPGLYSRTRDGFDPATGYLGRYGVFDPIPEDASGLITGIDVIIDIRADYYDIYPISLYLLVGQPSPSMYDLFAITAELSGGGAPTGDITRTLVNTETETWIGLDVQEMNTSPGVGPYCGFRYAVSVVPKPGNVLLALYSIRVVVTYTPSAPVALTLISVTPSESDIYGTVYGEGPGPRDVVLVGTHFLAGALVNFDNYPATNIVVVDPETITCTIPLGPANLADCTVTNPEIDPATDLYAIGTLADAFNYLDLPPITVDIDGITPETGSAAGGDLITITGQNFTPGATILFGGAPATEVTFVNSTTYTCRTPAHGPGFVDITLSFP